MKKLRITNAPRKPLDKNLIDLFSKKEKLKNEISSSLLLNEDDVEKLNLMIKDIEDEIADSNAEANFKTVKENVQHLVGGSDNFNCIKMWQLRKKLGVKKHEPAVAKKNIKGEIVTELKKLYEETYKRRLEHRIMKPELLNMYSMKMELFDLRKKYDE